MRISSYLYPLLFCLSLGTPSFAEEGEVQATKVERVGMGWRIEVTVSHPDSGWQHYIDYWIVETRAGDEIARRKLLHPHTQEQPFTRSLPSVTVPDGVHKVYIRLHCKRDGLGKHRYMVKLKD